MLNLDQKQLDQLPQQTDGSIYAMFPGQEIPAIVEKELSEINMQDYTMEVLMAVLGRSKPRDLLDLLITFHNTGALRQHVITRDNIAGQLKRIIDQSTIR